LLLESVKDSSRLAYKTGWNRWIVFVKLMGTNPFMTIIRLVIRYYAEFPNIWLHLLQIITLNLKRFRSLRK
jgi:hypothetical protein